MKNKGFRPSSRHLKVFTSPPTESEEIAIRSDCVKFQIEMVEFGHVKPTPGFDGTIAGLIRVYCTDPDSPFKALRYGSARHYTYFLGRIEKGHGSEKLSDLGARDFKRWYEAWASGTKVAFAHGAITILRLVLKFGASFEIEKAAGLKTQDCQRLRMILADTEFSLGAPRTATLTRRHCIAIRQQAPQMGLRSIALAQAFQFELTLRQRDVIGEWVPISEPGLSEITSHGMKWIRGLRWEEIGPDMVLRHQMSKSRKTKILEFDLNLYPMVMEELALIPPERRTGPVVIAEHTGMPWREHYFRPKWREVANAAGVPKEVRNMDSRAGGTTETIDVTDGNLEAARKQAGHSDVRTTQRYSRGNLESNSKVAVLRSAVKNGT